MDDPVFRSATVDDKEFAYQTKKAAFRVYVEKVWGWDEDEQRRLHERRFNSQDFQVIQLSGIDVGILSTERNSECIKVNQIYILPKYQGKGIGQQLMVRITKEAAGFDFPVRLQVLKVNTRAKSFYERLGFRNAGETDTHSLMEKLL